MSKDSDEWNRDPRTYRGRKAIVGSPREIVNKYAACGWPVAQMALMADNALVRSGWNHLSFLGGPEDDQES